MRRARGNRLLTVVLTTLLIINLIVFSTSCSSGNKDGRDGVFNYDLSANPRTLDPQTATDAPALTVIENLFDGLLSLDKDGNVTFGAASEYEVSKDEKTYTFTLRQDAFWTSKNGFEAQVTANDFVFGFKRLFNPEVKSKNAERYFCIKNAEKVNKKLLDLDSLGVKSDGDFKLIIELEEPNADFPRLLTGTPARPCNEEFYLLTEGRYGLTEDAAASNGAFYLSEWFYDPWWTFENKIALKRAPKASESVYPLAVYFYMDREAPYKMFASGESDCITLSGNEAQSLLKNSDYANSYASAETNVYVIDFNRGGVFSSVKARQTLAASTDISALSANINIAGYRNAKSLIPDGVKLGEEFYSDYNDDLSEEVSFSQDGLNPFELTSAFSFPPVVIVPDDEAILEYAGFLIQQWQEKLSLFCQIEALDSYNYSLRLSEGRYDLALRKVVASYNNPAAILEQVLEQGAGDNASAKLLIEQAKTASTFSESAKIYKRAELELIKSAEVIPVCFQTEYFFWRENCEDLIYNPFTGAIVFKEAKKF